jgi:integrase
LGQEPFETFLWGHGYADSTVTEYVKWIDRLHRWCDQHRVIPEAVTRSQVRQWADDTIPYSHSSRKGARSALGRWCQFANREDLTTAVRCPRKPQPMPSAPSDDHTAQIEGEAHRRALNGQREGVAVLLGLYLSKRRVEIARAAWTSDAGDRWSWQRAKTGDIATLPVHPRLREALDVWRPQCHSPFLFVGDRGRPHVTPATIWSWTRNLAADLGLELTTHQLKHAGTSKVAKTHGVPVAMAWTGHRDPRTTMIYVRTWEHDVQAAMESLDWAS